jgi:hypothetical protein
MIVLCFVMLSEAKHLFRFFVALPLRMTVFAVQHSEWHSIDDSNNFLIIAAGSPPKVLVIPVKAGIQWLYTMVIWTTVFTGVTVLKNRLQYIEKYFKTMLLNIAEGFKLLAHILADDPQVLQRGKFRSAVEIVCEQAVKIRRHTGIWCQVMLFSGVLPQIVELIARGRVRPFQCPLALFVL